MENFLPNMDIEEEIVKLFSQNYLTGLCDDLDKNKEKSPLTIFTHFTVTEAYSINSEYDDDIIEYGHVEFTHNINGDVIEFDIKHLVSNDDTIEYFDNYSMELGEKHGIKLTKKMIEYIFNEYEEYSTTNKENEEL